MSHVSAKPAAVKDYICSTFLSAIISAYIESNEATV
jgi:hypothetical protein